MQAEPYASARKIFWIVDNGASHRNWAAAARLHDVYRYVADVCLQDVMQPGHRCPHHHGFTSSAS
jgi:hypothetical protein